MRSSDINLEASEPIGKRFFSRASKYWVGPKDRGRPRAKGGGRSQADSSVSRLKANITVLGSPLHLKPCDLIGAYHTPVTRRDRSRAEPVEIYSAARDPRAHRIVSLRQRPAAAQVDLRLF